MKQTEIQAKYFTRWHYDSIETTSSKSEYIARVGKLANVANKRAKTLTTAISKVEFQKIEQPFSDTRTLLTTLISTFLITLRMFQLVKLFIKIFQSVNLGHLKTSFFIIWKQKHQPHVVASK